jgi:hypothetical protein
VKLYVAERGYDYEGFTIIGIFSTREAAEAACENDRRPPTDRYSPGVSRGDSHSVEEFELDVLTSE